MTPHECGKLGGAPMRTGSVASSNGATLSSVHVTRLQRIADASTGRQREHLEAAIACIRMLTRKNRRLGAQVGASMKRKVLSHRGLILSGTPEDIAQDIAELAATVQVTAYRQKRRVRVTTATALLPQGERARIGTYDAGCDYRQIVSDVQEALATVGAAIIQGAGNGPG